MPNVAYSEQMPRCCRSLATDTLFLCLRQRVKQIQCAATCFHEYRDAVLLLDHPAGHFGALHGFAAVAVSPSLGFLLRRFEVLREQWRQAEDSEVQRCARLTGVIR